MSKKVALRLASLIMLIIAVVFVICAISAPNLGKTVYIGSYAFGAEQWRVCYAVYVVIMVALFIVSFLVKDKKSNRKTPSSSPKEKSAENKEN